MVVVALIILFSIIAQILEQGSWIDNEEVQKMWAGLLASSCTEDGGDESNLIFTSILSQLTSLEAKILNHCCEKAEKFKTKVGWLMAKDFKMSLGEMQKLTGIFDLHRLDRELDHLHSLDLIEGGFHPDIDFADVTPRPLALQMYVRCQGSRGSPIEYFGLDKLRQPKTEKPG